jgi:hypothetical protein
LFVSFDHVESSSLPTGGYVWVPYSSLWPLSQRRISRDIVFTSESELRK